jgi:hypothetical protein
MEGSIPMRLNPHNTSRLFSYRDTTAEFQLIACSESVVVDVQAKNYDTSGHLHHDHCLANLSLTAAARLRDLLSEAVDHARCVTLDNRQTAAWGGSPARRRVA